MRLVSQDPCCRSNGVILLNELVEFIKVPFSVFYDDSKEFFDENVPIEFIEGTWERIKNPVRISAMQYEIYSPWPFYLAKEKTMQLPTGFEMIIHFGIEPCFQSKKFTVSVKNNRILTLTAFENTCINEGDPIARYTLGLGENNDTK